MEPAGAFRQRRRQFGFIRGLRQRGDEPGTTGTFIRSIQPESAAFCQPGAAFGESRA